MVLHKAHAHPVVSHAQYGLMYLLLFLGMKQHRCGHTTFAAPVVVDVCRFRTRHICGTVRELLWAGGAAVVVWAATQRAARHRQGANHTHEAGSLYLVGLWASSNDRMVVTHRACFWYLLQGQLDGHCWF